MASMLNIFCSQLMTVVKNEMKKVLAAATTAATTCSNTGGGNNAGGQSRTKGELKLCPNCNKKGTHKPEDCFMLPANASKKPANFIKGRYVKQNKKE